MSCRHQPGQVFCPQCDPHSSAYRPSAPVNRRPAPPAPLEWRRVALGLLLVPAALVAGYFLLCIGAVVMIICPLLPFIVAGIIWGLAAARERDRRTKATIDYAAYRLAQELAARRAKG